MKNVTGTIYETKKHHGGKGVSYTAEINYRGLRVRKSSVDRTICEKWLAGIVSKIDVARKEKEQTILEAKTKEAKTVKAIIERAINDDMRYAITARCKGLIRTDSPQTYILYNPFSDMYMIGKSKDPYKRLAAYCVPELRIVLISTEDTEIELRKKYADRRVMGSWFRLSENDIKTLEDVYKFRRL